jgi:hypothetical protein
MRAGCFTRVNQDNGQEGNTRLRGIIRKNSLNGSAALRGAIMGYSLNGVNLRFHAGFFLRMIGVFLLLFEITPFF